MNQIVIEFLCKMVDTSLKMAAPADAACRQ